MLSRTELQVCFLGKWRRKTRKAKLGGLLARKSYAFSAMRFLQGYESCFRSFVPHNNLRRNF